MEGDPGGWRRAPEWWRGWSGVVKGLGSGERTTEGRGVPQWVEGNPWDRGSSPDGRWGSLEG